MLIASAIFGCQKPKVYLIPPGQPFQIGPEGGKAYSAIILEDGKKKLVKGTIPLPGGWYVVPPPTK